MNPYESPQGMENCKHDPIALIQRGMKLLVIVIIFALFYPACVYFTWSNVSEFEKSCRYIFLLAWCLDVIVYSILFLSIDKVMETLLYI